MDKKQTKEEIKYFVRIANTDLEGAKPIRVALTKIKGIGRRMAGVVCNASNVDFGKKAGKLEDNEVKMINDVISDPAKYKIPSWMVNRRKDSVDGKDKHIITSDLIFTKEQDIKGMMKIKSYKGVRHSAKLTVRGQKTKSNFRRNKGKGSLGVKKKGARK